MVSKMYFTLQFTSADPWLYCLMSSSVSFDVIFFFLSALYLMNVCFLYSFKD